MVHPRSASRSRYFRFAEQAGAKDIVVTNDIQLAVRCLKSGTQVMGASGKPFDGDNIGMSLAMRALSQDIWDMG